MLNNKAFMPIKRKYYSFCGHFYSTRKSWQCSKIELISWALSTQLQCNQPIYKRKININEKNFWAFFFSSFSKWGTVFLTFIVNCYVFKAPGFIGLKNVQTENGDEHVFVWLYSSLQQASVVPMNCRHRLIWSCYNFQCIFENFTPFIRVSSYCLILFKQCVWWNSLHLLDHRIKLIGLFQSLNFHYTCIKSRLSSSMCTLVRCKGGHKPNEFFIKQALRMRNSKQSI